METENTTQTKTNSGLATMALILAIVGIVIAWAAYNRSGIDLENQIQQSANTAVDATAQELDEFQRGARDGSAEILRDSAEAIDTDE